MDNLSSRLKIAHLFDGNFRGPDMSADRNFKSNTTLDLFVTVKTELGDFELGLSNLLDKQYLTYYKKPNFLRLTILF
jgi:hypothetical protein